jgi:hypothetical protein
MTDRITYPDVLMPSKLAAGEEYASLAQIVMCDDRPQATIHVPQWRVDGKPAAIRVRALSLSQKERINRESTAQGAFSSQAQTLATIREGCVSPAFDREQAEALAEKSFHALEQIANFVWTLSALDQEWIERVVQTATGAEPAADDQPAATPRGRIRRVA